MHILQNALRIVGRTDAKQLFHFIILKLRQRVCGGMVTENCLFHFIAQDNVKAVGHLVRFRPYEAGTDIIDRPAENIKGNGLKLRKKFSQLSVNSTVKRAAAALP